jgi:hypothetical protein
LLTPIDHVSSSEIDEVNTALVDALGQNKRSGGISTVGSLTDVLSKVPGTGGFVQEAHRLQAESDAAAATMYRSGGIDGSDDGYSGYRASATAFQGPPGSAGGPPASGIPGMSTDPEAVIKKIYPILIFRDNVVRHISEVISKIPGLEALIDKITERITLFVLGLLAPFVIPIIQATTKSLKTGSSTLVDASGRSQYVIWEDPHCSDPTHSMLSKDHFSNALNEPAGQVAAEILLYVAPRVMYAMEHADVPVQQVLDDVLRIFHHPALRDPNLEIHRKMFAVVEKWGNANRSRNLDQLLGSESVKAGKNHRGGDSGHGSAGHSHGGLGSSSGQGAGGFEFSSLASNIPGFGSHSKVSGSPFEIFNQHRSRGFEDDGMPDLSGYNFEAPQQQQAGYSAAQGSGTPGQYPSQQEWAQQSQQPSYGYNAGTNYGSGYEGHQGQQQQQQQQPGYGQPQAGYGQQQQQPPQQGYGYPAQGQYGQGGNQGGNQGPYPQY